MTLAIEKRGILKNQVYLTSDRVELSFEMPLSEIVFDFTTNSNPFQEDMLLLITISKVISVPILLSWISC